MSMKRSLALEAILVVLTLVSLVPGVTGVGVHEWIGLAMALAFLVHVSMHMRGLGGKGAAEGTTAAGGSAVVDAFRGARLRRANLAVDALLFVVLAVVVVSGIGMSGAVLPTFGLYAEGYYLWNPLHAVSAKTLLALLIVHLALHARFVAVVLRAHAAP